MKKKILLESIQGVPENYFKVDAKLYSNGITLYDITDFTPKKNLFFGLSINKEGILDGLLLKGIFSQNDDGSVKQNKYGENVIVNFDKDELMEKLVEEMSNKIFELTPEFIKSFKDQIFEILTTKDDYFTDTLSLDRDSLEFTNIFFRNVEKENLENVFSRATIEDMPDLTTVKLSNYIFPLKDGSFTSLPDVEKESIAKNVLQEIFFVHRNEILNGSKISLYTLNMSPTVYDSDRIFLQKKAVMARYRIIHKK
jgi:hypothetical protein